MELPNLEYDNPTSDAAALQGVAQATGAAVYELADLAKMAEAFKIRRVERTLEDRQEMWDAPLLWATILIAVTLEWLLRKRFRLV